jgi:hypothetical protein
MSAQQSKQTKKLFSYRRCKRATFAKKTDGGRPSSALTVPQGPQRLDLELDRLGARSVIVSTKVELNSFGEPRGDRREPEDPGVAVYSSLRTRTACWPATAGIARRDNLAAVAAHIDAIRRIGPLRRRHARSGFRRLRHAAAARHQYRPPSPKVLGIVEDENTSVAAIQAAPRPASSFQEIERLKKGVIP